MLIFAQSTLFPTQCLADSINSRFLSPKKYIYIYFFLFQRLFGHLFLHVTIYCMLLTQQWEYRLDWVPRLLRLLEWTQASNPWHCSSLVTELTLQVCCHEMWRLLTVCTTFPLIDIWEEQLWKLFCSLIEGPPAKLPVQLISVHLQPPWKAWAVGSWIYAPASCSLKTIV